MTIRGKPDVDAFLDGGNEMAKAPEVSMYGQRPTESTKRTKKLFELPEVMVADLEQKCVDERRRVGRRVTQTEIVEHALSLYLYGNK